MVPTPPRPLLTHGLRLWAVVHEAGDVRGNVEPFLILCEQLDERVNLRVGIFSRKYPVADDGEIYEIEPGDIAAMRTALRALDQQIVDGLERLGLRTIMPQGATVVADDWTVELASLRE